MPFGLSPTLLLARLVVLLFGMPIHEWAHAWSAYQLGDDTASMQGRLDLNPLAHLDPIGSILILLTGFGWAKPVPVNPYRMRINPRTGMALIALAGPVSNLLVAALCAIPFRLGLLDLRDIFVTDSFLNLTVLLWTIAQVSVGLALFNLLPFYPLDGEKVLLGVLPRRWSNALEDFRPYSPYVLMLLLFVLPWLGVNVIGLLFGLVWEPVMGLLFLW